MCVRRKGSPLREIQAWLGRIRAFSFPEAEDSASRRGHAWNTVHSFEACRHSDTCEIPNDALADDQENDTYSQAKRTTVHDGQDTGKRTAVNGLQRHVLWQS